MLLLLTLVTVLLLWAGYRLHREANAWSSALIALGVLSGVVLLGGFFGFMGG